ncbi:hypothetical protein QR680_003904 [Steinernema hermaphroditum]|uniref:F-box domain-containing protein n=1 Tax=Steinernema hermaphroditum TaxID=289476 RepID=A0AA39HM06_9BILA|nr:hypothetical protein QR680_003904 [Steinernema hermaphroditum]
MDFLPYDLVDHLIEFLPLNDVKTIVKATVGNRDLATWTRTAEEHLRERYLLDVNVYLEEQGDCDKMSPERPRLENEQNNVIMVRMYIEKRLFGGTRPLAAWDFKNWRHARLGKVEFYACWPDCCAVPYPQADPEEVVRVISLPVALKNEARQPSSLGFSYLCPHQLDPALNMANSVQKTFTTLTWSDCWNGSYGKVNDFLCSYLDREVFLEELRIYIEDVWMLEDGPLSERIIALFERKSSLKLAVGTIPVFQQDDIITHWKKSGGMYRGYKEFYMCDCWQRTENCKHEPINLEWMDSWIARWKNSDGFYVHEGKRKMKLLMNDEEWEKFIGKYSTVGEGLKTSLSIDHPLNFATLEISRGPETLVTYEANPKKLSSAGMWDVIAKWKKGNGHCFVDRSRRIEVVLDYPTLRSMFPNRHSYDVVFVEHPRDNARLKIEKAIFDNSSSTLKRITVVPIDHKEVEDWSLDMLFGRQ